jgi:hypothetical protein
MAKTCAIISGNTVSNVIMVDDIEQSSKDLNAVLIEYTPENPAGIGWTYDEETGRFSKSEDTEIEDTEVSE